MKWHAVVMTVAFTTITQARGADDDIGHVYRLEVTRPAGTKVELTGFKVKGKDGLFTALHGVVGAHAIVAWHPTKKVATKIDLQIAEVDVDRDVAFLAPIAPAKCPPGGLGLGLPPKLDTIVGEKLTVIGFPLGVDLLASETPLIGRRPLPVTLTELLNPNAREVLNLRRSPAVTVQVLGIEGNLLPGHSGAPIFDRERALVAIGNGGLEGGRVGWGWAIPFHDIKLTPVGDKILAARLTELAKTTTGLGYFRVIDETVRRQAVQLGISTRSVIVSKDDGPVLAFPMTPKQAMEGQINRLKEVLDLMKQGKADKLNPADEFNRLMQKFHPLPDGTVVEVLEIEDPKAGGAPPAMPMLPFPIPAGPAGKKDDPFGMLGGLLGDAAQQVNVKVRVLEGPSKGKELWVHRSAIKRETVMKDLK